MAKVKSEIQGVDGAFYIVNPSGTIHTVTKAHASNRLRTAGYRLAEDPEISIYLETRVQRHNKPICEQWTPEPQVEDVLPAATSTKVEATDSALKLAIENDVDLAGAVGTGAGGRIIIKDVEKAMRDVRE